MTGDNVQHWDDVADLPWRQAFEMSCPTAAPAPVVVPGRRRTDIRTLADVVAEMGCAA